MSGRLNENIRKLRLQIGINQVVLAQRLCVTKQCVSNWETGKRAISVDNLRKIAEFFCVPVEFIFKSTPEELKEHYKKERKLLNIINQLNEEELKELNNYINFLKSKRQQ